MNVVKLCRNLASSEWQWNYVLEFKMMDITKRKQTRSNP